LRYSEGSPRTAIASDLRSDKLLHLKNLVGSLVAEIFAIQAGKSQLWQKPGRSENGWKPEFVVVLRNTPNNMTHESDNLHLALMHFVYFKMYPQFKFQYN
jgi:hypothetical protein